MNIDALLVRGKGNRCGRNANADSEPRTAHGMKTFRTPPGGEHRGRTGPRRSSDQPDGSAYIPPCPHYPNCFGCPLIDRPYPRQLSLKQQRLTDALAAHTELADSQVDRIVGSPQRLGYRARVKLVVGKHNGAVVAGLYVPGTHRVADISACPVHPKAVNQVVQYLKKQITQLDITPYDEATDSGQLRYFDIRYSLWRQELVVTLVTRHDDFPQGRTLARELKRRFRFVSGVVQNVNQAKGNVIWGKHFRTLVGRDSILERNGFVQLSFPAGVFSQTNPKIARKLYQHVLEVTALTGKETVLDCYCGVGPISLHLASGAKLVWGVDDNPLSIATAKQNARMNGIANCRFSSGDVSDFLRESAQRLPPVDVVTVNPPRKGIQPAAMDAILSLQASQFIYVSCEPMTLTRDLNTLVNQGYRITNIRPFDMFPQTEEVETVAHLSRGYRV